MSLLLTYIAILFIIIFHEAGHFLVAKMLRVPVTEFAIGFGKKLLSKEWHGTIYSLRVFPIGGFCSFGDANDDNLNKQPVYKRVLICVAGTFSNMFTAFIVAVIMVSALGVPTSTLEIETVQNEQISMIQAGDELTAINNVVITDFSDIDIVLKEADTDIVPITIQRGEEQITEDVALMKSGNSRYIGLSFKGVYQKIPLLQSFSVGFDYCVMFVGSIMQSLGGIITRQVGFNDLSGIIGIAAVMTDAAKQQVSSLLSYFIFLSINIGIFNLLPIPGLDGSKVIFAVISKFCRSEKAKERLVNVETALTVVTVCLLFIFMIAISAKDVISLF